MMLYQSGVGTINNNLTIAPAPRFDERCLALARMAGPSLHTIDQLSLVSGASTLTLITRMKSVAGLSRMERVLVPAEDLEAAHSSVL